MKFLVQALFLGLLSACTAAIKVEDSIPADVELQFGFPPERINVKERVRGKKVLLIGLPGAFTPT